MELSNRILNTPLQILDYLSHNDTCCLSEKELKTISEVFLNDINQQNKHAEEFLKWSHQREFVQVIKQEIPIKNSTVSGSWYLNDVKVKPKRSRGDDEIYFNHEDIREKIARGNSVLENPPYSQIVIRGLKKFTGGPGDEDDTDITNDSVWKKFFLKQIESTTTIVALSKANGEAAHFSARYFGNDFILFAGSKNVHLAFSNKDDINAYKNQTRYEMAIPIAEAVIEFLENIGIMKALQLLSFLHHTRFTAVCELLNPLHMHVVNLSSLPKKELNFIAWTTTDLKKDTESYCGLSPEIGMKVTSIFGFQSVSYEILAPDQAEERLQKIRHSYQQEGEVLYYLDKNQAVIGIIKRKTTWYIIVRAVREQTKAMCRCLKKSLNSTNCPNHHYIKMQSRLIEIKKWLQLDDALVKVWEKLSSAFMKWAYHQMIKKQLTLESLESIFPDIWKDFLNSGKGRHFTDNVTAQIRK